MISTPFLRDRRGVSTAVAFTLAIGISIILIAGLLVSMGALLESQETRAIDSELATVGEGLAVDIEEVARMSDQVDRGDDVLAMRIEAPDTIAGIPYSVRIRKPTVDDVQLEIVTRDRSYTVDLVGAEVVEPGSIPGGTIWIVADTEGVHLQKEAP